MKVKVKFTLQQITNDQRASRGLALLFNLGVRMGWVVNATLRPLYPRQTDLIFIVHEAGWAPRPVWTDAENLVPTGIRSPDGPVQTKFNWYYYKDARSRCFKRTLVLDFRPEYLHGI